MLWVQFNLPILTILTCCYLTQANLYHRHRPAILPNSLQAVSMTMLIVAGCYLLLNLPFCVYLTIHFIEVVTRRTLVRYTLGSRVVDVLIRVGYEVMTVHVIPLTAAMQTLVLFSRNQHIQMFGRRMLGLGGRGREEASSGMVTRTSTQVTNRGVTMELRQLSVMTCPSMTVTTLQTSTSLPELSSHGHGHIRSRDRPRSNSVDTHL